MKDHVKVHWVGYKNLVIIPWVALEVKICMEGVLLRYNG